jgi:mRNA interferase RelE/StbE
MFGKILVWTINYTETAREQLRKFDKPIARRIIDFMDERVANRKNPRDTGKALTGAFGGLWRYRIGDYRVICEIDDEALCVLVIGVGNRDRIYR